MSGGAPTLSLALRHRFASGFSLDLAFETEAHTLALFGPSGSGKSSILAAIAGLYRPDEGRLVVGERCLFDSASSLWSPPRDRRVGLVLQDALLFPLLSVRKNLLFGARGKEGALDLEEVARMLEIGKLLDRHPRNLSGGERQRVALGRAILSEPSLLLCDEPFSALDASLRDRLMHLLARVRDELSIPLVLVSHRVREVAALAEDILIIEEGRLMNQGGPLELLKSSKGIAGEHRNLWEGVVEGASIVRVGPCRVHTAARDLANDQKVRLLVDPGRVALSIDAPKSTSHRNRFEGEVVSLSRDERGVRVLLDVGIPVLAIVTPAAVSDLGLRVGSRAWVIIKASAVELFGGGGAERNAPGSDPRALEF